MFLFECSHIDGREAVNRLELDAGRFNSYFFVYFSSCDQRLAACKQS